VMAAANRNKKVGGGGGEMSRKRLAIGF
jgi:hypothetical protein